VASHLGEITTINTELGAQYECGFIPFSDSRLQFEIQFYLISLLFIVFDVEIALILPYSLVTLEVGFHGFYLIAGFFIILGLGFILEWESGILNLVKVR
jgi:NADH:ubiquinone oxidoreductase subunit 3 (subunit A)